MTSADGLPSNRVVGIAASGRSSVHRHRPRTRGTRRVRNKSAADVPTLSDAAVLNDQLVLSKDNGELMSFDKAVGRLGRGEKDVRLENIGGRLFHFPVAALPRSIAVTYGHSTNLMQSRYLTIWSRALLLVADRAYGSERFAMVSTSSQASLAKQNTSSRTPFAKSIFSRPRATGCGPQRPAALSSLAATLRQNRSLQKSTCCLATRSRILRAMSSRRPKALISKRRQANSSFHRAGPAK